MNLLFLCPTFHPHKGGAESLFDDLAGLLVQRGHRVTVLAEVDGRSLPLDTRRGAQVLRIKYPRFKPQPRALARFCRDALR